MKIGDKNQPKLIYGVSDAKSYIAFRNDDAHTDHTSKNIKMVGSVDHHISETEYLTNSAGNEVAGYRKERDMDKISNENGGGRIYPAAVTEMPSDEKSRKICRERGIAVIKVNKNKYKKQDKKLEEEQKKQGLLQPEQQQEQQAGLTEESSGRGM